MSLIRHKSSKYISVILAVLIIGIAGYVIYGLFSDNNSTIGQSENGYRVDKEPIINRFPKLGNFEKCYWKADTIGKNSRLSAPAPSSYWMKGFVILNSKELDTFKSQYKWLDVENSWKPSLDADILKVQSLKWSYSEDFNNYIKSSSYVGKFYLDVENGIVFFDVQK
ncbi:MAG: hypothetical protein FIA99_19165 [Ruminiclostridium sp.]|nr:hypothetical protein [Ruminiclostridium sp.]